ncbi:MAG TPA: hypothetical protein PK659_10565 [Methanothrix sp.]|nr:hypothetical protein [Methanothrix sp.]HOK59319.1 hypothetical protein [Methanothrix sp.]HOL44685.1 hypothetical protein [Methanothrix sp.]
MSEPNTPITTADVIQYASSMLDDASVEERIILTNLARRYIECESCRRSFDLHMFESIDELLAYIAVEPSVNMLLCPEHMMFRTTLIGGHPIFFGTLDSFRLFSGPNFYRWADGMALLKAIRRNGGSVTIYATSGRGAQQDPDKVFRVTLWEERLFGENLQDYLEDGVVVDEELYERLGLSIFEEVEEDGIC